MKVITAIIAMLLATNVFAQDVTGRFKGTLRFTDAFINGQSSPLPNGIAKTQPLDIVVRKNRRGFRVFLPRANYAELKVLRTTKKQITIEGKEEIQLIEGVLCSLSQFLYIKEFSQYTLTTSQNILSCENGAELIAHYRKKWARS